MIRGWSRYTEGGGPAPAVDATGSCVSPAVRPAPKHTRKCRRCPPERAAPGRPGGGDARNRARSAAPQGCRQRRSGAQRAAGTRAQRTARTGGFLPLPRAISTIFALASAAWIAALLACGCRAAHAAFVASFRGCWGGTEPLRPVRTAPGHPPHPHVHPNAP